MKLAVLREGSALSEPRRRASAGGLDFERRVDRISLHWSALRSEQRLAFRCRRRSRASGAQTELGPPRQTRPTSRMVPHAAWLEASKQRKVIGARLRAGRSIHSLAITTKTVTLTIEMRATRRARDTRSRRPSLAFRAAMSSFRIPCLLNTPPRRPRGQGELPTPRNTTRISARTQVGAFDLRVPQIDQLLVIPPGSQPKERHLATDRQDRQPGESPSSGSGRNTAEPHEIAEGHPHEHRQT